jgi:hypothetical protein
MRSDLALVEGRILALKPKRTVAICAPMIPREYGGEP